MIQFQKRREKENWQTVETSMVENINHVSATLDRIEKSYKGFQVRAIDSSNRVVDIR